MTEQLMFELLERSAVDSRLTLGARGFLTVIFETSMRSKTPCQRLDELKKRTSFSEIRSYIKELLKFKYCGRIEMCVKPEFEGDLKKELGYQFFLRPANQKKAHPKEKNKFTFLPYDKDLEPR